VILQHGEGHYGLSKYADLHLLVTQTEIDWQSVIEQAVVFRWTYGVQRALALTAQFFDTPLPESVITQLQNRRPADEDVSFAIRLRARDNRGEGTINQLRQLTWGQMLRFLYATGSPPQDFLRYRYSVQGGRPIWPYYFHRWFDLGCALGRTIRNHLSTNLPPEAGSL
jgi:hypothetical protein